MWVPVTRSCPPSCSEISNCYIELKAASLKFPFDLVQIRFEIHTLQSTWRLCLDFFLAMEHQLLLFFCVFWEHRYGKSNFGTGNKVIHWSSHIPLDPGRNQNETNGNLPLLMQESHLCCKGQDERTFLNTLSINVTIALPKCLKIFVHLFILKNLLHLY